MNEQLELRAERDGEHWILQSPDVGLFTCALPQGAALAPGQRAGVLLRLGQAFSVVVPSGVTGVVTSERPERVQAPVGFAEELYRVRAGIGADDASGAAEEAQGGLSGKPALLATQSGRFYRSPSPDEPAFVEQGDELTDGTAVGLIEVMKTFTQVVYRADGSLPARARVARILARDGDDLSIGSPIIEVEPL